MSQSLTGKSALITGGTSGIGLESAKLFAAEGARVFVTGASAESVASAKKALGNSAEVIRSDSGDSAQIKALFSYLQKQVGSLDVLFLNAGIAKFAPLEHLSEADFDDVYRINVKGPWLEVKHALPLLQPGASIVLNTSINNEIGMANSSIYAASKAALRSLARTLSGELISRGIRVNAVSPGPTETQIFGKLGLSAEQVQGFATSVKAQIPLGRFGRAHEIAKTALFLASDDSSFIVGAEIVADGGMSQL
jgi:NAD(P)-dependent dehydrogenase (short-subunit alcohol dehydrogenase family)